MNKKTIGYGLFLLNAIGSAFTGALGIAFVILAVYLAWTDINNAARFKAKFLIMPVMNILISSMLFFYCRQLLSKAKRIRKHVKAGIFETPRLQVTPYDIIAIIAFLAMVGVISYLVF